MDWLKQTFFGTSAGTVITESNRFFTINGINVALPTDGNVSSALHWQTASVNGTYNPSSPGINYAGASGGNSSYYAQGTSGNAGAGISINPSYDDYLAIWDSINTGTSSGPGNSGTPTGWSDNYYWTATPSFSGHAAVYLGDATVRDRFDSNIHYVVLQVL
jgi:hypothetical protein